MTTIKVHQLQHVNNHEIKEGTEGEQWEKEGGGRSRSRRMPPSPLETDNASLHGFRSGRYQFLLGISKNL